MRPRSEFAQFVSSPFKSELKNLTRTQNLARDHISGGSYNLISYCINNGAWIGRNRLSRSSNRVKSIYPIEAGLHAELDLWRQTSNLAGATVYTAGFNAKSHNMMANTAPCIFCLILLIQENVRSVIFHLDHVPAKLTLNKLPEYFIDELNQAAKEYSWGI